MVLVWPEMTKRVIVTQLTTDATLVVSFMGTGTAVEVCPEEKLLYPDLHHPATAGILMSMWLESGPQLEMSLKRWTEAQGEEVVRKGTKSWEIHMNMAKYGTPAAGDFFGVGVAKMLYMTWKRQERLTPKRITRPNPILATVFGDRVPKQTKPFGSKGS